MEEFIHALDTISGRIADLPRAQFENPEFSWHLVEVPEDTKEVAIELVKPMSAEEWNIAHDSTPSDGIAPNALAPNTEVVQ